MTSAHTAEDAGSFSAELAVCSRIEASRRLSSDDVGPRIRSMISIGDPRETRPRGTYEPTEILRLEFHDTVVVDDFFGPKAGDVQKIIDFAPVAKGSAACAWCTARRVSAARQPPGLSCSPRWRARAARRGQRSACSRSSPMPCPIPSCSPSRIGSSVVMVRCVRPSKGRSLRCRFGSSNRAASETPPTGCSPASPPAPATPTRAVQPLP